MVLKKIKKREREREGEKRRSFQHRESTTTSTSFGHSWGLIAWTTTERAAFSLVLFMARLFYLK